MMDKHYTLSEDPLDFDLLRISVDDPPLLEWEAEKALEATKLFRTAICIYLALHSAPIILHYHIFHSDVNC